MQFGVTSGWMCRCCLHQLAIEKLVALYHKQGISKNKQHLGKPLAPLRIL